MRWGKLDCCQNGLDSFQQPAEMVGMLDLRVSVWGAPPLSAGACAFIIVEDFGGWNEGIVFDGVLLAIFFKGLLISSRRPFRSSPHKWFEDATYPLLVNRGTSSKPAKWQISC